MALTRRSFIRTVGAGGAALVSAPALAARGSEALLAAGPFEAPQSGARPLVRLDSNENPDGPGPKALAAIRDAIAEAPLYPHRAGSTLPDAIARFHGLAPDQVLATCGSGELLRMSVEAFTSPDRALVTAVPTFETCTRTAQFLRHALREVPVDAGLALDLEAMAEAASAGAGLVFFCNPNNPTGTVYGAARVKAFVSQVRRSSPGTIVLIDEAYHEYVEDPAYATAIPLALESPQVIVCRTFSKVHGLAGVRVGYVVGRPETLKRLAGWRLGNGLNMLGIRAATAAIDDREHVARGVAANRAGRETLRRFFEGRGCRVAPSHTNFVLADIGRDAAAFQKSCRALGVAVGRPFPPLTTWTRVSVGTEAEVRQAIGVFETVLSRPA